MIKDAQGALESRHRHGMIQSGSGVQANQRAAVNRAGDDMPRSAAQRRKDQQNYKAYDAEPEADSMSDGVG